MKKLLFTSKVTSLLTGCGAQPAQESTSKTPVKPVTLVPAQPVPEATPSKPTAQTPALPVPEVKPVEPVAKKKQAG